MSQHLIESPRTEQQSLKTCCLPLEEQWDFLRGSLSSVELRLSILLQKHFFHCVLLLKNPIKDKQAPTE